MPLCCLEALLCVELPFPADWPVSDYWLLVLLHVSSTRQPDSSRNVVSLVLQIDIEDHMGVKKCSIFCIFSVHHCIVFSGVQPCIETLFYSIFVNLFYFIFILAFVPFYILLHLHFLKFIFFYLFKLNFISISVLFILIFFIYIKKSWFYLFVINYYFIFIWLFIPFVFYILFDLFLFLLSF